VMPVDETPGSATYGQVPCQIVEAMFGGTDGCSCDTPGRAAADTALRSAYVAALERYELCGGTTGNACDTACLCEITQFSGSDLDACQVEEEPPALTGFCYVDETLEFVNPALVQDCPASSRRKLRFLDADAQIPREGATLLVSCTSLPT
jgi:hypothetical protein